MKGNWKETAMDLGIKVLQATAGGIVGALAWRGGQAAAKKVKKSKKK